jgi:hypothetical protein
MHAHLVRCVLSWSIRTVQYVMAGSYDEIRACYGASNMMTLRDLGGKAARAAACSRFARHGDARSVEHASVAHVQNTRTARIQRSLAKRVARMVRQPKSLWTNLSAYVIISR